VRDGIRLYLRYVSMSLRSQLQYPASFLMLVVGNLAITGIEFLTIWALFSRFGSLGEWSLPEVACFMEWYIWLLLSRRQRLGD